MISVLLSLFKFFLILHLLVLTLASFYVMRCRVLYDFVAEEEGELSAKADTEVNVTGSLNTQDGWVLVETTIVPFSKGYMPRDYLAPIPTTTTTSTVADAPILPITNAPVTLSAEKSPTGVSSFAPVRRLSDPRLPQHLLETLDPSEGAGVSSADITGVGPVSEVSVAQSTPTELTTTATTVTSMNSLRGHVQPSVAGAAASEDFCTTLCGPR